MRMNSIGQAIKLTRNEPSLYPARWTHLPGDNALLCLAILSVWQACSLARDGVHPLVVQCVFPGVAARKLAHAECRQLASREAALSRALTLWVDSIISRTLLCQQTVVKGVFTTEHLLTVCSFSARVRKRART